MVTPMPGIVASAPLLEPPLNTYLHCMKNDLEVWGEEYDN